VTYTDAFTTTPLSDIIAAGGATTNTVGLHDNGARVIYAKSGTNIGYSLSNYASSGATAMQYGVGIRIEALQY
jgi:hypothetical protein